MMKKIETLVVDSDVIQSSSAGSSTAGRASKCASLLLAIINNGHIAAVSDELLAEWARHKSRFAIKWQAQMYGRKKIKKFAPVEKTRLLAKLDTQTLSPSQKKALEKDMHLVALAASSRGAIASLDQTVRKLLSTTCSNCTDVSTIMWINPDSEIEWILHWMRDGLVFKADRTLGA